MCNSTVDTVQIDPLNSISKDPEFVNQGAGNFMLQTDSPCIDLGSAGFVSEDFSDVDDDTKDDEDTP